MTKMTFKRIPYDASRQYDYMLDRVITKIHSICDDEDDDALNLAFGETSSGKSNLFLWFTHSYLGDKRDIKYIAMTRGGFTKALKEIKNADKPRLLMYDEANLSKRDSIAKWNKMMIDTYFSIRGKNICHLWCNPSIDYLDKEFIEERIKRVFLCIKPKGRAKKLPYRVYYYFKIENILQIYEKYGNLKFKTIYKVRKRYATYMGWYKKYDGDTKLLEDYMQLKDTRMDEKIDQLHETFGDGEAKEIPKKDQMIDKILELKAKNMSVPIIAKVLDVTERTIYYKLSEYRSSNLGTM